MTAGITYIEDVTSWMQRGQDVGLIGPASLVFHRTHAQGFAGIAEISSLLEAGCAALDLGSGGGIPGLVLAEDFPASQWTLVDSRLRSVQHLESALEESALQDRVTLVHGRGEEAARATTLREKFGLVTARGFGPPFQTAEIGSGFLEVGGALVVSDPPDGGDDRWNTAGLARVGLEVEQTWAQDEGHYRLLRKVAALSDDYPRRNGVPKKRPLW